MRHKRGDTFYLEARFADTADTPATPIDLTGWSIRAQVRLDDSLKTLLAELTVVVTDATAGQFTLTALPEVTENWPVGERAFMDIEYTDPSGRVMSTSTTSIDIVQDWTYG